MTLTQIAFVMFSLVASGGVLMVGIITAKQKVPTLIHTGHGLFGLAALAVLFVANLRGANTSPQAWWAFGVFAAGFVGGLTLFRVLFAGRPTILLAAMHGSLGAVGLYLLYTAAAF